MENLKIGIYSLGLIGGSLAMSIRKKLPNTRITAINRSAEPIRMALDTGVIDNGGQALNEDFKDLDFIFLCGPVSTNIDFMKKLRPYIGPDTILTDVGSVKGEIHAAVKEILPGCRFIGGHPMAGSERSGYINASPTLLENAFFILTPQEGIPQELVEKYSAFVRAIGSIPLVLSPEGHDYVAAAVSHVPHFAAYALVQLLKESDLEDEPMKRIAAGGFKDITRIASSDPTMWQQISLANREQILKVLNGYIERLYGFKGLVERSDGEGLKKLFQEMKDYRDSIGIPASGAKNAIHDFYVDIEDEAGAISRVAALLSDAGLSIKNIGIIHNRSYEKGALRIEFYGDKEKSAAAEALEKEGYTVTAP